MKLWYAITCPVCGFRHSLRKFTRAVEPIAYPVQLVTGGGRGRGFRVVEYLPWSSVPKLKETPEVWTALNCEYIRLASAYDAFYDQLGFLSPRLTETMNHLNSEIFRLQAVCRDLKDRLERLLLTYPRGGDSVGESGRILEEISKRDQQDRSSALDLIK